MKRLRGWSGLMEVTSNVAKQQCAQKRAEAERRIDWANLSAEEFLESHDFCDIAISPAQRALARGSDGLPITHLGPLDLEYHCGARVLPPPMRKPRRVVCRSGRRSGKTLIAGMLGLVRKALTLALRREPKDDERPERDGLVGVRKGEPVRGLIVAPRLAQSVATFGILAAILVESPKLKQYLVGTPAAESLTLRRDDGQLVTIEVKAAAPKGTNLRGGWFIGVVFDEADFFGEKDASIKLEDQMDAVSPALIPGAQMWAISSPWDESGEFYAMHTEAFGAPDETFAFHSSSQRMNPTHCDAEDIEKQRLKKPEFVSREFDAVPMAAGSEQFFPEASIIAACIRDAPLKLEPNGAPHWAGSDPGLRKNSATLALARNTGGKAELAYYEEKIPPRKSPEQALEDRKKGIPPGLSPSVIFGSFAKTALAYKATKIQGDQYYEDDAIEQMPKVKGERGETVWYDTIVDNNDSTADLCTKFRSMLNEGQVILPRDPTLMQQLRDTKSRRGQGKVLVTLPRTGAAHGDLLKAVVLAMVQVPLNYVEPKPYERRHSRHGMNLGEGRGF